MNRGNKIKPLICLVFCFAFLLAGCAKTDNAPAESTQPEQTANQQAEQTENAETGLVGSPWVNSDLAGNLPGQAPDSKDDFHQAVNYDWLSKAEIPDGSVLVSSFTDLENQRKEEILKLISDDTLTGREAELVKILYASVIDMDTRNEEGAEPLRPYIDKIQAVSSIEELTELLCGGEDMIAAPLCNLSVNTDDKDNSAYVVEIKPTSLSLSDANSYKELTDTAKQKKEINDTAYEKLFERMGYTEQEAQAMNDAAFAVETQIAAGCYGADAVAREDYRELTYNVRTLNELEKESSVFPLAQILETNGYGGSEKYVLSEPEWLKVMNEVYTEENLEGLKALLLYDVFGKTCKYLDQGFLDIYNEKIAAVYGISGEQPLEQMAYDDCNKYLAMAVGKIYVDNYFTEDVKQDVEETIDMVRSVFKERLRTEDWLTDETREKAVEKLDAMTVRVGYPDVWTDYSSLALRSAEDGGNLMDNMVRIYSFEKERAKQKIGTSVQKGEWSECYPQEVNAFYNEKDNSINIPAGILGGAFYDKDGTKEQRLGGIGSIIGHEFTHAFDTLGSQYDKDGNRKNWWTDEDRAAFKERTDKVAAYYDQIEVLPDLTVDGELTIGETVADLGGIACMMDIAKTIDGFDYKAFFNAYAQVWRKSASEAFCTMQTSADAHPLGYVRTNVNVQQMQEFYDAYGLGENDGMYVAPDERLAVW